MENPENPQPTHYLLTRDELLRLLIHAVKTSGKHYNQKQFKERVEFMMNHYRAVALNQEPPNTQVENSAEISP